MSPELGVRDKGLFRPPLSEVPTSESITLDVPDSVSRLCFSKLASLRGWLDTDADCKSFRRLLFEGSSSETYPLFRPLSWGGGSVRFWAAAVGSRRGLGRMALTADALGERTARNRVFFLGGTSFWFFCTPLGWFSISYQRGQRWNGEGEGEGVLGASCRLVANVFLGGILSGREDNGEETLDYFSGRGSGAGETKRCRSEKVGERAVLRPLMFTK